MMVIPGPVWPWGLAILAPACWAFAMTGCLFRCSGRLRLWMLAAPLIIMYVMGQLRMLVYGVY